MQSAAALAACRRASHIERMKMVSKSTEMERNKGLTCRYQASSNGCPNKMFSRTVAAKIHACQERKRKQVDNETL